MISKNKGKPTKLDNISKRVFKTYTHILTDGSFLLRAVNILGHCQLLNANVTGPMATLPCIAKIEVEVDMKKNTISK